MIKPRLTLLTLLLLTAASGTLWAEQVTGVTEIYYNETGNTVVGVGQTFADYSTFFYYDLEMSTSVAPSGSYGNSSWTGRCYDCNYVGLVVETPATPNQEYVAESSHIIDVKYDVWEITYCGYQCDYSADVFGYSLVANAPPPSPTPPDIHVDVWAAPMYFVTTYSFQIYLGPTRAKTTTPGNTAPVYTLESRAFIPVPWIASPAPWDFCIYSPFPGFPITLSPTLYKGDNRGFAGITGAYRTDTRALVQTGTHSLQNLTRDTGQSDQYAFLGLPLNGDGTISSQADDWVFGDCYLRNQTGKAGTYDMHADASGSVSSTWVHFWGAAGNPLTWSPTIDWDFNILINTPPILAPSYTIFWNHNCFPAHEVWINSSQMLYGRAPSSYDPFTIAGCLFGGANVVGSESGGIF